MPYSRPPITEAVLEVRFKESVLPDILASSVRDYQAHYQRSETVQGYELQFNIPTTPGEQVRTTARGAELSYKLISPDEGEILLLSASSFAVSQLAPYPGWDIFFGRFQRDLKIWKATVGYQGLSRYGLRFINRLDLPNLTGKVEDSDYITIYPKVPHQLNIMDAYGLQLQTTLFDINCHLRMNTSVVPSPLLNHISIILDFEIATFGTVPQNLSGMIELLGRIRMKKNEIFELCITERARDLFR